MTEAFKIVNNTGSAVPIKDVGDEVPASGFILIPNYDRHKFADSVDIDALLDAVTLSIEHNSIVLNAFDGKCLVHEETDYHTSEKDTPSISVVTQKTKVIRYIGSVWVVTNPAPGRTEVATTLSNTAEGKESSLEFFDNGTVNDKWLNLVGANTPSDNTPGILSSNCKLRSITYTNAKNDTGGDIEVYKNGLTVPFIFFTWQIRDSRYAWKTNGLDAITFSAGDRCRVFIRGIGGQTNPSKAVVILTFVNTDDILGEGAANII